MATKISLTESRPTPILYWSKFLSLIHTWNLVLHPSPGGNKQHPRYDAPVKRIWVSLAMSWYKSPKLSDGAAMMTWISPHHWSVWGIYTGISPANCVFAWPGHCIRLVWRIVAEFSTAYAPLGGHFWWRRPLWYRAVGGWPLVVGVVHANVEQKHWKRNILSVFHEFFNWPMSYSWHNFFRRCNWFQKLIVESLSTKLSLLCKVFNKII